MSSDERRLNELVDRDLPWPTQMEFVAARDRVLDQLRATPAHRHAVASRTAAPNHFSTRPWALAVAVALVIAAVGGAIVWPRGAVRVYAGGNDGLQVTLADDSRVEMRAHAEMTVGPASNGIQIDLKTGDIIVTAARQRDGHLYVRTKDMTVALSAVAHRAKVDVDGTVFLVNTSQGGSRVGVIEGEVSVREGNRETRLRPGEQVATSSAIVAQPLTEGITWSRNATSHLALLDSFMKAMTRTSGALTPVAPPRQAAAVAGRPASPEFEEASIRECDPDNLPAAVPGVRGGGGANSFYMTPGRTYALCMTVATLIRTAYQYAPVEAELDGMTTDPKTPARWRRPMGWNSVAGLGAEDGRRVRGGPDWVRTERYTIEAAADGPANAATMSGPMLLALLERRLKLKAHVETEPVPALALVVAPGGLKIKPAEPDSCMSVPLDPAGRGRLGNEAPHVVPSVRRGEKRWCGQALERNGPNRVFVAGGSTLTDLAQLLGMRFLGPMRVYDRTGITDKFDWILEFTPEEDHFGAAGARGGSPAEPSNVPPAPSIFVALEQLGLRLEPAQAPREFVVIDAIERPGPN